MAVKPKQPATPQKGGAKNATGGKNVESSKAVATQKAAGLPALNFMNESDVGAGKGNADKDSYAIPFLTIVQKMSPQVDEDDPKYLEDAKPGMFINTVTQELFDGKDGLIFLPCAFQRRFIHWGPRGGEGSGFKGEMLPEEAAQLRQDGTVEEVEGRLYYPLSNGKVDEKKSDYLSDTRNHFGIMIHPDTGEAVQVLLSLGSTQIKKSKRLMTLLDNVKVAGKNGKVTPPTWVNRVKLTTIPESNDKGSWSGIDIAMDGLIEEQELYVLGKQFHDMVSAGSVNVNYDQAADTAERAEGGQF